MCGNNYVARDTPFTLFARDEPRNGSGVRSTTYRIFNATYDSGWREYTPLDATMEGGWLKYPSFNLSSLADGKYTVEFYSTDNALNVEPRLPYFNSCNVTLFSWTYIFEDSCGRGTVLKINTHYEFFRFVAPNKDFGIMKAQEMRQYDVRDSGFITRRLFVKYCDSSLQFTAKVDLNITYCIAQMHDLESCKRYNLFDFGISLDYWLAPNPSEFRRILELILI
jgi:hypothetical protein